MARRTKTTPRERHWRATLFQSYVVVAAVGFGLLSLVARRKQHFALDLKILRAVQRLDTPISHSLMQVASYPGNPPQATALAAIVPVLLYRKGFKWEAATAVISTVGISIVGLLVKLVIDRQRPHPDLVRVLRVLDGGKQSFPAGHVQIYVPVFGFIAFLSGTLLKRSWERAAALGGSLAMIALVGPSRIHSGEHWPSDVLGGYFLGSLWLWLTVQFYRWGNSRKATTIKEVITCDQS
jgi:undecaprenyl-diphosphatase